MSKSRWICGDTIGKIAFVKCTLSINHKSKHRYEIVCKDFISQIKDAKELQRGARIWVKYYACTDVYECIDRCTEWMEFRILYGV